MDPITISFVLNMLMKHPDMAASAVQSLSAPNVVNVSKMQESFADLSKEVLLCYHKTARFHLADPVQSPWDRQAQYGADNSTVIRIRYSGMSATQYEMLVAVMAKNNKIRTSVISDNALIPYNKKCKQKTGLGLERMEHAEKRWAICPPYKERFLCNLNAF